VSRVDIERCTCDRCGAVADLERGSEDHKAWTVLCILEPREITADLCPTCFKGLQAYLDGQPLSLAHTPAWHPARDFPRSARAEVVDAPRENVVSEQVEVIQKGTMVPEPGSDMERLRDMWLAGTVGREIAEALGIPLPHVYGAAKMLGLPSRPRGGARRGRAGADSPHHDQGRRFAVGSPLRRHVTPRSGRSVVLKPDHPAILNSRTLFPTTVVDPADSPRLLVAGHNQRKIGGKVVKGEWKGMPIFCLTLEERATCPRTCTVWHECYGNNMHMARRHRHGPELLAKLRDELTALQAAHTTGFVVRLHILGDFYSVDYVRFWQDALHHLPALRIFGFTAHSIDSDIGQEVLAMNMQQPLRCRIRYSDGAHAGGMGALVVDEPGPGYVVCPAQTEKTDCCSTCGLCWTMNRVVGFLRHGEALAAGDPAE
jgi:hypothetical protein